MPVQINITGTDAAESLRELSALSAGLFGGSASATPVQEEKPKRNTRSTKTDTKPESTKPEPVQKDEVEPQVDPQTDDGEDIPDDVALRAAATEKAKVVGKAKIKALLDKYEVANVTAIPDDQRVAFMQELEDLA